MALHHMQSAAASYPAERGFAARSRLAERAFPPEV